MFFSPRLNRERKGGMIAFDANTEIIVPDIKAADYIKRTVKDKLLSENKDATFCKKLTFVLGFPEEIKAKIEKHTRMSGNDEEYAVLVGEETFVCAKRREDLSSVFPHLFTFLTRASCLQDLSTTTPYALCADTAFICRDVRI